MSPDLAQAKKRLIAMAIVDVIAMIAAAGFAIGTFRYGIDWMLGAFVVSILVGIAAQIWFIAGLGRVNRGA